MAPIAIVRKISRTANIHVVDFIFLPLSMLIVLLNKLVSRSQGLRKIGIS